MRILIWLALYFIVGSCKTKPANEPISAITNTDTVHFYQVSDFLQSQVNDVLKKTFVIYKQTSGDNAKDSTIITKRQFATIASQFIYPDISKAPLKKQYTETVFFDRTTNNYTLNYSTKNKNLEVQNIDVLLREDGQTLKRIFIRKFFNYDNDSSAIEQLSWKPSEQFVVARIVQKPGAKETSLQTTVVWNAKK